MSDICGISAYRHAEIGSHATKERRMSRHLLNERAASGTQTRPTMPGAARCCVPYGRAAPEPPWGAAPRGPRRRPRGSPTFFGESRRKEHQGGRGSSSLDPPFLVGGTLVGSLFFSAWPAALYLTSVTARPPAGRAGGGGFSDGKGSSHPQSLPLGGKVPQCSHWGG